MTEPIDIADGQGASDPSLAVACVRALMERHGLAKYRQSAWLAGAFGLSYSQAHRRMTGASPWSLEDLARVAALLGESLVDLISATQQRTSVSATLSIGPTRLPCEVWLGEVTDQPSADSVVALKTSAGWSAIAASEATGQVVYKIERLEAKPNVAARKVVAVLDDDQDLTNSIVTHLDASGYEARPFYKTKDLLSSAESLRYDGYVVDWIVGESNVLKLIAALRAQDAKVPIIVLTAQVTTGVVKEADIADAVSRYNLVFHEKPVRTSILAATLSRAFALP